MAKNVIRFVTQNRTIHVTNEIEIPRSACENKQKLTNLLKNVYFTRCSGAPKNSTILLAFIGSVVEWLKHRTDDQHDLGSKPTYAILLCPWERHFTALSPAWWS